ncbi:MAG: L,D-transpeptidase [Candidatus Dormibacterales bacterium]
MTKPGRWRRAALLATSALLAAAAVVVGTFGAQASNASTSFDGARQRLQADLNQAAGVGYTQQELAPIVGRARSLEGTQAPVWVGDQPAFYLDLSTQMARLDQGLRGVEGSALVNVRGRAEGALQQAGVQVAAAGAVGAYPADLAPLESRLAGARADEAGAIWPSNYLSVISEASAIISGAEALAKAQEAQIAVIEAAGQQLLVQDGGSVVKVRAAGRAALAAARNDASLAAYMRFNDYQRSYSSLEHFATLLTAADPNQVAVGAAGVIHYAKDLHARFLADLPAKTIVVSHDAQQLWAYQGGKLLLTTPVTTGRPQLPTDMGRMSVLFKSSPWKMVSPWPRSSPWYYPPTVVQMVLWFTDTGEGLHDAYWEWSSQYGRGSEFGPAASHGCIHVPYQQEVSLFNWASVGTPVVVYPGDGSPVASQLSQITVDANGNPLTGPKGA